jgi:hypothetical protein
MTETELRRAEKALAVAQRRYDAAREARNALIRRALAEGWTHARIAAVTGLSRGRISQFR